MDLIVREKKEVKGLFDISSSSQILVPHKFDDWIISTPYIQNESQIDPSQTGYLSRSRTY